MKYHFTLFQAKYWVLFVIGLGLYQPTYAQDTIRTGVILKFTPSMMLDADNTITVGAEIPLSALWSIQQEIGWGNSVMNLWDDRSQYPDKNNWRFRTQIRYFISKNKEEGGGWYVAAEYFRKEIFYKQPHAFGRDCNPTTGRCAYFEEGTLSTRRRVSALHGKFGYQWVIPNTRAVFDVYMGAGYRKLIVSNDDPSPQENNVFRNGFLSFRTLRPGSYEPTVSLSGGFSLGIFLGQKKKKALPLRS